MFAEHFDRVVPVTVQQEVAQSSFENQKRIWRENQKNRLAKETEEKLNPSSARTEEKTKGKKFFETNRNFERLVPSFYKRTKAPRISTLGSTLHGMKKDLLKDVLTELSRRFYVDFLEI